MATRAQVATDAFADLANFTQLNSANGSIAVHASGKFYGENSADCVARWTGAGSFEADQYSSILMSGLNNTTGYIGAICRASGSGGTQTYYAVRIYDGAGGTASRTIRLWKCVNGTPDTGSPWLSSGVVTSDATRLEIEAEGSTVRALIDGVLIPGFEITDPSPISGTGTSPGVYASAGAAIGDDFIGGNLTAASTPMVMTLDIAHV